MTVIVCFFLCFQINTKIHADKMVILGCHWENPILHCFVKNMTCIDVVARLVVFYVIVWFAVGEHNEYSEVTFFCSSVTGARSSSI